MASKGQQTFKPGAKCWPLLLNLCAVPLATIGPMELAFAKTLSQRPFKVAISGWSKLFLNYVPNMQVSRAPTYAKEEYANPALSNAAQRLARLR